MPRYIAFLRGINIGKKQVKMDALSRMFSDIGFEDIKTYIQSGNVVLSSKEKEEKTLREQIEKYLHKELGWEISVVLRTVPELEKLVKELPFKDQESNPEYMIYVTMLAQEPQPEKQEKLIASKTEDEVFKVEGRDIYILCRKGTYGESRFSNTYIEKVLKQPATTRNWNTINKMIELGK